MKYRFLIDGNDVTDFIGSVSWRDSLDTLGSQLSFTLATSRRDRRFSSVWDYTLGSKAQIINVEGSLLDTVITEESIGERTTDFTAYDMAWYLNKSTVVRQFKKMQGNECVKALCKDLEIPVEVKGLDAIIDKIYRDMTVAEVIQDIIGQCSKHSPKDFFLEFYLGKLVIRPFEKIEVKGSFEAYPGTFYDVASNAGSISLSRSIEDLKNSVLVVTGDKQAVRVEGKAEDEESIEKFGKVQEVIELDEKDYGKANLVAKNELKKLNVVAENFSIRVLGDDKVRSGRVIKLDLPLYGLSGDYLIKEANHTLDGGIHMTDLVLEAYRDE